MAQFLDVVGGICETPDCLRPAKITLEFAKPGTKPLRICGYCAGALAEHFKSGGAPIVINEPAPRVITDGVRRYPTKPVPFNE